MFDRSNAAPAPNANNAGVPDNKKAIGFLNLYLPNKAGTGRRKLGYIALRGAPGSSDRAIAEWLLEDPTRVEVIMRQLTMEFNSAEADEGSGFNLVDDRVPSPDSIPG